MKCIALILSVYIMVLTAIPCVDKPEDTSIQKTEISPKTTGSQPQDADHCSPFCTCNCCSSPKIQQELVVSFTSFPISCDYFEGFFAINVSEPAAAIWQPPQLV